MAALLARADRDPASTAALAVRSLAAVLCRAPCSSPWPARIRPWEGLRAMQWSSLIDIALLAMLVALVSYLARLAGSARS
ncbi:MAG TPA: hypothetical protein VLW50_27675 [Streptosporangiaceae bacterium]|nr:hypothetical protein [Streptosporangiaceae bacterium]